MFIQSKIRFPRIINLEAALPQRLDFNLGDAENLFGPQKQGRCNCLCEILLNNCEVDGHTV